MGASLRSIVVGRRAEQIGFRLAGEWIRSRGEGALIISSNDKPVFYAKGRIASLSTPLNSQADYLVLTEEEARARDVGSFALLKKFPEPARKKVKSVLVFGRTP